MPKFETSYCDYGFILAYRDTLSFPRIWEHENLMFYEISDVELKPLWLNRKWWKSGQQLYKLKNCVFPEFEFLSFRPGEELHYCPNKAYLELKLYVLSNT